MKFDNEAFIKIKLQVLNTDYRHDKDELLTYK